jgi:YihY family inner membrane protein
VSTAQLVPETRGLSGDDAWSTLRRVGRRRLVVDAVQRMRVSDGFSHARSLAFLSSLAAVQGIIALVGLGAVAGGTGFSDAIVATIRRAVPGPAGEVLTSAVAQAGANATEHRYPGLLLGLVGSVVTTTTAFGQIERGLNRLYGVEEDRPFVPKYRRALALALTSGTLTALAFVCLALGRDLVRTSHARGLSTVWNLTRWPLGLLLIAVAVTLVLHACPRRCQPRLSWLAFGAAIGVGIWAVATAALGLFFHLSHAFGQTYGPLAGLVALMLWALLTAIALLLGAAVAAQLEAARQGDPGPQDDEKVAGSEPSADDRLYSAAIRA